VPRKKRRPTSLGRRDAVLAGIATTFFGGAAPAHAALNYGAVGSVVTIDEDEPFRAALQQIANLLDKLGVEGAVDAKKPEVPPGPPIERSFRVGPKPGTDRLRACPETGEPCLSSARNERPAQLISPYVFFDQKGDSVGRLIELLYQSRDAQLLTARGNFFSGQGVYVLAELVDRAADAVHDIEFQFLPGVLESVVDVRIVLREGGPGASSTPKSSSADPTLERQRVLVRAFADRLDWLPLAEAGGPPLDANRREIVEASRTEMRYRDKFEEAMEKADAELETAMVRERQRIDELKREVRDLLEALSKQEDARMNEYLELRSRTAETRDEYEQGVAKRIGGYANTGRYAGSQNIRLSSSFAGLINSQDDTLSKIYDQAAAPEDESSTEKKPPRKKK